MPHCLGSLSNKACLCIDAIFFYIYIYIYIYMSHGQECQVPHDVAGASGKQSAEHQLLDSFGRFHCSEFCRRREEKVRDPGLPSGQAWARL